ncbi:MAG: SMC-Scp complex subunit ScpB [Clostridiales bacterium]|nr:SMC-Scp complex subunit ScpB [Clostridiales bacterium]
MIEMKNLEKLTSIIESILFVSGTQVAIADITEKLEVSEKEVNSAVKVLQEKYAGDSGIQLLSFNKKLQFCSNPKNADEVSSVLNPIKERELSKSMLEVAAIIAYKQPVTRIDLEEIRGNSEYAVQKLLELGVIEPVGRKDAVGKPVLFGTTDKFLKRFQISSLDELPDYDELINKIQLIRGNKQEEDYLYHKDVYVDETDGTEKSVEEQVAVTKLNEEDDFELPDIEDEELPDFLKGEDVEKI